MPAVRVTRYEGERNLMPKVCARCGGPADGGVQIVLFTPLSNLVFGASLILCPPFFIAAATIAQMWRRFLVPMCPLDQADWRWRDRVTTWTYIAMVLPAYFVAGVLMFVLPTAGDTSELLIAAGYLLFMYTWLVPAVLCFTRTVRTSKVMKRGIRLSGVHPNFIRALMADRVQSRETDPARAAWYGDLRDDFEEDWNEDGAFRPDAQPEQKGESAPPAQRSEVSGQLGGTPESDSRR